MNAEQKQRAKDALQKWHSRNDDSPREYQSAELMTALLQELVDAPEPEPFGYFKDEPFGWTDCAETDDGAIALYTAPPAPSVPDGWKNAAEWLRNNYQDYPNISSLCEAMVAQSANNGSN